MRPVPRTAILDRPLAPPRRRDSAATRGAILEAGKRQFAQFGYDRTVQREIAAEAGADVALIKRYFGGKEGLFVEALKSAIGAQDRLRGWDRAAFAREIATLMAGNPHAQEDRTQTFQFLLRAATSPSTAPLLNLAVQERFLGPIRDWLGGKESAARARVLAAVHIGFLVERLIRGKALTGPEREAFIDRAAATIQGLIDAPTPGP